MKNEEVRRRVEKKWNCQVDQRVFRWFGHIDRKDDEIDKKW